MSFQSVSRPFHEPVAVLHHDDTITAEQLARVRRMIAEDPEWYQRPLILPEGMRLDFIQRDPDHLPSVSMSPPVDRQASFWGFVQAMLTFAVLVVLLLMWRSV